MRTVFVVVEKSFEVYKMHTKHSEDLIVDMINHKYTFEELDEIINKHCLTLIVRIQKSAPKGRFF